MFLKKPRSYRMFITLLLFIAIISLIFSYGCTQKSDQVSSTGGYKDPPSGVEKGKHLFDTRGCMGCHAVKGKGGNVGPDLSNEANAGHSRQWLSTQIRDPKKNDPQTLMPAFDTLSDSQVNDLVSYLLSLSTKQSKTNENPVQTVASSTASSAEPNTFSLTEAGKRWSVTCGECHNLRAPEEYSDAQWEVAVHHMRIRVPLTGEDQKMILKFLQESN